MCGGEQEPEKGSAGNRERGSGAGTPALGCVRLGLLGTTQDWLALGAARWCSASTFSFSEGFSEKQHERRAVSMSARATSVVLSKH